MSKIVATVHIQVSEQYKPLQLQIYSDTDIPKLIREFAATYQLSEIINDYLLSQVNSKLNCKNGNISSSKMKCCQNLKAKKYKTSKQEIQQQQNYTPNCQSYKIMDQSNKNGYSPINRLNLEAATIQPFHQYFEVCKPNKQNIFLVNDIHFQHFKQPYFDFLTVKNKLQNQLKCFGVGFENFRQRQIFKQKVQNKENIYTFESHKKRAKWLQNRQKNEKIASCNKI